ncbi:hypothetical protein FNF31_00273 [Cafeteria roenbergensis]|uniref:EF-hand domain-containing protein n=1 Tax=Cafeteria roenbergensis TaxID=33653 RepID=A0A5A8DXE2_CAFRO|nr:hypothetical protein FNF31_00273 [Cafeteria roenbergensis]
MAASLALSGQALRVKGRAHGRKVIEAKSPKVSAELAWKLLDRKLVERFKHVNDAFVRTDVDYSGFLSRAEFRDMLKRKLGLDMEDKEFEAFWSKFDTTKDDRVDFVEFNNRIGTMMLPPSGQVMADRPETPRLPKWQRSRMAAAIKSKFRDLDRAFQEADTNGSGNICHAEFIQALRKVGLGKIGDDESFKLMRKFKAPGDTSTTMSRDEFRKVIGEYLSLPDLPDRGELIDKQSGLPLLKLAAAEEALATKLRGRFATVQRAFRLFDEDKSGSLSQSEFRLALRALGINVSDRDFKTLTMQYDVSGDGTVSYDEFNARVGPLLHPSAAHRGRLFREMESKSGAWDETAVRGVGGRAHHSGDSPADAPASLGLSGAEELLAKSMYGRFSEIQHAFRAMDSDCSGFISKDEFAAAVKRLGGAVPAEVISELMAKYDTNGDGTVSIDEFNTTVGPLLGRTAENQALLGLRSGELVPPAKSVRPATAGARSSSRPGSVRSTPRPRSVQGSRTLAPGDYSVRRSPESARSRGSALSRSEGRPASRGSAVPQLTFPRVASATAGSRAARTGAARPGSRQSANRFGETVPYDRRTGFVSSVRRGSSRFGGVPAHSSARRAGSGADPAADASAAEEKMRAVLGSSWAEAFRDFESQGLRRAGNAVSAASFRDVMASRGVPLTSTEVRGLARKHAAAPSVSGRRQVTSLNVDSLMRSTFGSLGNPRTPSAVA